MRPIVFARSFTTALLTTTALSPLAFHQAQAQSLPTGASVAYGSVGFQRSSGTLTINQSSQNAIVNYQTFSIGRNNTVNINQPNASSAILNRVTGNTPSTIAGHLNANGQVYLVNPNGIAITKTGVVKVGGGFVASTLGMSDDDFKAGRRQFKGGGASARVSNAGTITIGRGGYAALLGGEVRNSGSIAVPMGKVGLGSGETAALDVSGDGFLQVALPTARSGKGALVSNSGLIAAAGGTVVLDAATARAAAREAVNISGTIDAHSISGHSGSIIIGGGAGGRVSVSGRLSVASRHGTGGSITLTGQAITLKHARLDASGKRGGGSIRIGGDLHGGGTLQHAGTVTIDAKSVIRADALTKGDGGSVVVWSDETTHFAGLISAKGGVRGGDGGNTEVSSHGVLDYTGSTVLTAAKGATGTLLLDPYNVTISSGTDSGYGATTTSGTTTDTPTGTSVINATTLQTQLATANVTITTGAAGSAGSDAGNITVAAPVTWSSVSLLTLTAANAIAINANISITGAGGLALNALTTTVNVQSAQPLISFGNGASVSYAIGSGSGIAGQSLSINNTAYTLLYTLANSGSTGPDSGTSDVAGINANSVAGGNRGHYALATNLTGTGSAQNPQFISALVDAGNSAFTGTFNGLGHTISNLTISSTSLLHAGLFGTVGAGGTVANLGLVGGSVTDTSTQAYVGGLAGSNAGTITQSYNTGTVRGAYQGFTGGLVGFNNAGSIAQSYATGGISQAAAFGRVGGLVGFNRAGTITQSYATGTVDTGNAAVGGGLVGINGGAITQSYATGAVRAGLATTVGGLVGRNFGTYGPTSYTGTITSSYYDAATTGQAAGPQSNGSVGVTTAGLANATTLGALNSGGVVFGNAGNQTTPYLLNNVGPVFLATDPATASTTPTFYTPILSLAALQAIGSTGNYVLAQNFDATGVTGFVPIGESTAFAGTFNGLGFTISNLTITSSAQYAGLFGQVGSGGTVENVGLISGSVTDTAQFAYVGALVGANSGTITQAYATGSVTGGQSAYVGGLVGLNTTSSGAIGQSYATGPVRGGFAADVGGLVGVNSLGAIGQSYATGTVTGGSFAAVGGLAGYNNGGIAQAFWDTATTGVATRGVGGGSQSGATPVSTQQLANAGTLAALNVNGTVWGNGGNQTTPYLLNNVGPVFLATDPATASTTPTFYTPILSMSALQAINPTGNYVLGQNLDATGVTGFVPISESTPFTGTFNGLGFAISNLTITSTAQYAGLFGQVGNGGTVERVGLIGGSVTDTAGGSSVGGLVGTNYGVVAQSYATGAVVGSGFSSVGGLVGINGGTIMQAYATGTVSGSIPGNVGGLVGLNFNMGGAATISQAYATGAVSGGSNVGALVGNNGGTITSSYWDTTTNSGGSDSSSGVTPVTTAGLASANTLAALNSNGVVWGNAGNQTTPYLLNAPGPVYLGTDTRTAPTAYTAIVSVVGLQAVDANPTGNYVLGQTIDATGVTGFVPIGQSTAFTGTFNGLGFAISNLTITSSAAYAGLFGQVGTGGTVANVGLVGGSVTDTASGASVGSLVGGNSGTIMQAYATSAATGGDSSYVGGLVGTNAGTIMQTYASGTATAGGNAAVGGLVGGNLAAITQSYAMGPANGGAGTAVGGLVGENAAGTIMQAYATGAASGTGGTNSFVGGLVGVNLSMITQAYATGTVSGGPGSAVGGLVGSDGGTTTSGYWDTQTTGQSGGLTTAQLAAALPAGFDRTAWGNAGNQTTPYLLANVGPVLLATDPASVATSTTPTFYTPILSLAALQAIGSSGKYVLAQNLDATGVTGFVPISESTAFTGTFNGLGHTISNLVINTVGTFAGLFGQVGVGGTIENVGMLGGSVTDTASGAVVGGLVGQNAYGTITQSYATGAITGGNGSVGGLVGFNLGTIKQSYATGGVSGVGAVGGLVGADFYGTIEQSYAMGAVGGGGSRVGGLVGSFNGSTITDGYYDAATTGQATGTRIDGSVGLSTQALANATTLAALNSNGTVWGNAGNQTTPYLLANPGPVILATDPASVASSTTPTFYTAVLSLAGLQAINTNLAGNYVLGQNIDASGTTFTTAPIAGGGTGASPAPFSGTLEGLGYAVTSLTVSGANDYVGLVGISTGTLRDIAVSGGSVSGASYVGGLVGYNNGGTVSNVYTTNAVRGAVARVGGLAGQNSNGNITQSYATGAVSGLSEVGGLVGINYLGTINQSYATGATSSPYGALGVANGLVAGLVGENDGTITQSTFDTSTSGLSASQGIGTGTMSGVTGYTTRQLQGLDLLPSGTITDANHLGSAFAGGTGGLYPYLTAFFPGGMQAVSGFAYKDAGTTPAASGAAGAVTVSLDGNNGQIAQATTGANGYYYAFVPAGTVAAGSLLVSTSANATTGATNSATLAAVAATAGNQTGVNLFGNAVTVPTMATLLSQAPVLAAAQTSATTAAGSDAAAAAAVATTTGRGLFVTGASFTIDQAVTTSSTFVAQTAAGAPLTVAQPMTIQSGGSLGLLSGGTLAIDAPLTAQGAVSVALTATTLTVPGTATSVLDLSFARGDAITYTNAGSTTPATSSQGGALSVNGTPYTLLYTIGDVANVNSNLAGAYALAGTIDATGTTFVTGVIAGGAPSSNPTTTFSGTLEGLGHAISNLTVTGGSNQFVGLVGASSGTIRDIGVGGSIGGFSNVGALVGENSGGTVAESYATASVNASGPYTVGGLVGWNNGGTIVQSYAAGAVTAGASQYVGGLVGANSGIVTQSYATGATTGDSNVGGLVGFNNGGSVTQSYETGAVIGNGMYSIGGLVGWNNGGLVAGSYATGATSGSSVAQYVGGLVGANGGMVTQSYATGAVNNGSGSPFTGGLLGNNNGGSVSLSAYDATTTGPAAGIGGAGASQSGATALTTAQLQSTATANPFGTGSGFSGGAAGGETGVYPYLTSFFPNGVQAVTGTALVGSQVGFYAGGTLLGGGTVSTGANGYVYQAVAAGTLPASGTVKIGALVTPANGVAATGLVYTDAGIVTANVLPLGAIATGVVNETTAEQTYSALQADVGNTFGTATVRPTSVSAATSINATNTNGFTLDQPVTAGGAYTVTTSGPLALAATLSAPNQIVTLNSAGTITQATGTGNGITVGTLTGSSSGNATFNSMANQIGTLGAFSTSAGDLSLVDSQALTLAGAVSVGAGTLDLAVTGDLNQSSGTITAGTLTGQSSGAATFGQSGNAVTNLGAFSGTGITFVDTIASLGLTGSIASTGSTKLTNAGGNVVLAAGGSVIGATVLIAADGTFTNQAGANAVQAGAGFTIYTQTPSDIAGTLPVDTFGGLSGTNYYNDVYSFSTGAFASTVPGGANHFVYGYAASLTPTLGGSAGKVYDGSSTAPTANLTLTASGFANANGGTDTASLSFTGASYDTPNVGSGKLVSVGGIAFASNPNNYTLGSVSASARIGTIGAATLIYVADAARSTYGSTPTGLGGTVSGFAAGENPGNATTGTLSFATMATGSSNVGSYAITGSGLTANNGNYTFAQAGSNATALTVTPAPVVVTALGGSSTYGSSPANPGLSATGLQNGQGVSVLTGLTNSFGIGATTNAGSYGTSVVGTLTNANYTVSNTVNGSWTVNPAALTITAANQSKTYGQTVVLGTTAFGETGLVNGDTVTGVSLASTGAATSAGVTGSPYAIVASNAQGTGLSNYTIAYVNGALTVNPAALTITAANQSKTYGQTASLGTTAFGETGLINGDTISGVTLASNGAAAGAGVAGSPYAITASNAQGTGLSNYTIAYANGMLTVTPASVSVTAASGTAIYGNAPANPGLVATGLQNGEGVATLSGLSSSFALISRTDAGTYALGVVGTNTNPNYTVTGTSGGSYAVTPRPITITATSEARLQGAPNPPLAYQIGGLGLVNGDTLGGSLFTSALPSSPIGAYPIVQGTLAASPNYAVSFVPGTLAVTPDASLGTSGLASPIVPRTAIVEGADDLLSGLLSSPTDGTLASNVIESLSDPRFEGIVVCVNGRCFVVPRSVVSPKTADNQKQASR